ncbi:hypothetical protein GCM10027046_00890 [Uliginosibacterium flavum]
MYYQQKKAKAAALAAAQKSEGSSSASGNLATAPTSAGISTPELIDDALNAEAPTQSAPAAIAPRRKARPLADNKKKQDDKFAESVLTQAPAGAGPLDALPPTGAGPQDIVPGAPQAPTPGPTIAQGPSDGPGTGNIPGTAPNPIPAGTGGIVGPGTTVTPVTAVPEPSTWLMMAAGLGLLVSASRRRNK